MIVGSVFSGIGGFDRGLELAGHVIAWQCESDSACQRVLARHWPATTRYGDIRTAKPWPVELLCGGFPCQDISVAGNRAGLAGERSRLFFDLMSLAARLSPRWLLIENPDGLLSSNGGRDMGTVLGRLEKLGYWWAYRVLDSQYFGLAQRRHRVFIVGCLADRLGPPQVLFEPESLPGPAPAVRSAREEIAGTLGGGSGQRGWPDDTDRMTFIPAVTGTLSAGAHPGSYNGQDAYNDLFVIQDGREMEKAQNGLGVAQGVAYTLDATGAQAVASPSRGVRRLTPLEWERLQGFPDGWTADESDSARYRMLGNAVSVPVAEWIGRRMVAYEASAAKVAARA